MTLPNLLTFFRIFISPVFLVIYMKHDAMGISASFLPHILLALLVISELSDAFDGYIARRFNQVSDFGKLVDPMADSIARISVFLTFTFPPINLPLLVVFAFLYRDSVISTLRTICALRGFALAARMSGKLKAVIQGVVSITIVLLMIPHAMGLLSQAELESISFWLVLGAAIYALFSGVDYIYANRAYIRKALVAKGGYDTV